MSLILSIDTSTSVCSVALHNEQKLLVSQELFFDRSHSGSLISLIRNAVDYTGYTLKDLSAIAISKGPGSYTGLRIGTSTAKGLCLSLDIPLIAVNTLKAMAFGVNIFNTENSLLCPMIDARRMEVYCMVLNEKLEVINNTEALVLQDDSFKEYLQESKVLFFGNGSDKAISLFEKDENAVFIPGVYPSAAHVGALALSRLLNEDFEDLAYFEPFYLKDFAGPK